MAELLLLAAKPLAELRILFPTVVRVDIPFSSDRRKMFSEQIPTAAETVLNNSLRSMGKGMSTITMQVYRVNILV